MRLMQRTYCVFFIKQYLIFKFINMKLCFDLFNFLKKKTNFKTTVAVTKNSSDVTLVNNLSKPMLG